MLAITAAWAYKLDEAKSIRPVGQTFNTRLDSSTEISKVYVFIANLQSFP
jgi:hypothetical protein